MVNAINISRFSVIQKNRSIYLGITICIQIIIKQQYKLTFTLWFKCIIITYPHKLKTKCLRSDLSHSTKDVYIDLLFKE